MPLPLEDHVRVVLLENDRGSKLYLAVSEAWRAFCDLYPQRHRWLRKSSSRHMMWEEVAFRLKNLAAADSAVEAIEHQDTMSLIVENEVLIRLKHADMALVTHNYPTVEAQAFDNHDVELFGYAGLQRVRLCYVLDQFEANLLWVGVAAHSEGHFLWKLELTSAGAQPQPQPLLFPESTPDTAKLARLKNLETKSDDKKKNDGK